MLNLLTENIDIWTSAKIQKNGIGRGNSSANQSLYGIKKLRDLILELAVRGKLVPQDPKDLPAPRPGVWFVYVLECEDGSYYKGHTKDILERWKQHARGTGAEWTDKHPPRKLVHWEEYSTEHAAVEREKELKTGFGRKWLEREIKAGRTRQAGEPASVLLEKIAKEKTRLEKEGKIHKQKSPPVITDAEKPFKISAGWEFCRFGALVNSLVSGGTPSKSNPQYWNGKIPWASVKDLGKDKYLEKTQDYITKLGLDAGSKLADIGDVIICTRMGLGKIAVTKVAVAINQDLKAIKLTSLLNLDFFLIFFATLNIKGTGTTVAGIRQDVLLRFIFPLPPRAEQHRIVTKVNELMALCDKLEQQQVDSNDIHQTLVETLLATLTTAADANELNETWQCIADYFDILFTTEQSIDQLKQTILQLAVMGKLVAQYPKDEPASVLLEKIAKEKARLIKDGKIKKEKPLPEISEIEKPYELPGNWKWTRLGIVTLINPRNDAADDSRASFVSMSMITTSHTGEHGQEERSWGSIKQGFTNFANGDIGLAKITPCFENSKAAVFSNLVNGIGAGTTELHIARPLKNTLFSRYVLLYLKSPNYLILGKTKMTGTAGQKRVPKDFFAKNPFPLPPLAEQRRIVAKVDELMAICDKLKTRLQEAQTTKIHLADAIVEQAVL